MPTEITLLDCSECFDLWTWVAVYKDGTTFQECKPPEHHTFGDLDLDQIDSLAWIPRERSDLAQVVVDVKEANVRPILFRRRLVELSLSDGDSRPHSTIHCIGWQKLLPDGHKIESFTFVFADGSILTSADRNAV